MYSIFRGARLICLTAALVLMTGVRAFAVEAPATVLINFDVDPGGAPVPTGTKIDSTYASIGVIFDHSLSTCDPGIYASSECLQRGTTSPPNVVTTCGGSSCSDIAENYQGFIRASFTPEVEKVCVNFIIENAQSRAVLRAYDSSHQLIEELLSTVGTDQLMCISSPGIASVEFSGYLTGYGWFDDLSFDTPVPVSPTTFSAIKTMYH